MALFSTRSGYRMLALSAALALPGLASAQQVPAEALNYFTAKAKAQGLSAADVANPLVTNSYFDAAMGLTHTYLLQRVNGVPVFGATGDLHTDKSGKVVSSYQAFVAGAAAKAPSATPTLSATDGIAAAAAALGLPRPTGLILSDEKLGTEGVMRFNKGAVSVDDILVQLVYAPTATGLALAWNVTIGQADKPHYWNTCVDAHTGRLLSKNDLTVSEQSSFAQASQRLLRRRPALASNEAATAATALRNPTSTTAATSVTAFPIPLESPLQGNRAVIAMPSVGNTYSPYGWAVGQSSTTFGDNYSRLSSGKFLTRGNNVAAYDDYGNTSNTTTNLYNSNSSPDGGATMSYDYPFVQASGARNNLNPSVTNLFYMNNMMHDVMMAHGFNEAAGNYQYKNATQTTGGNDFVQAEAQDGSGRNNANFTPTVDGVPGRMQMFLWDNLDQTITITSPSSIAGKYNYVPTTAFGSDLASLGSVCGNIVPVNDGTGNNGGIYSCSVNYANAAAVNGNIALIQRAGCSTTALSAFVNKVKNAQLNGATLAIVYNNDPADATTYVTMGGTDPDITIPAIFISGADGAKIRNALTGSAVAVGCAANQTLADFDGSFDNGVMSHEYGHGISNRLTGGGTSASCVTQSYNSGTAWTQCPGEGWSDFLALWMTTKPTDNSATKRYMGAYVYNYAPGLRAYPYTSNMNAATGGNPQHYGLITPQTGTNPTYYQESHGLGEIWTSVLWDLNWQFIAKYGYSTDFYSSTMGGNNKCLKLVLDAMRIQPCNPSFLQARNAILKVDSLNNLPTATNTNRALIWTVFARRGMGYSAKGGTRTGNNLPMLDVTEAFDMPPGLTAVALASRNATATSALEAYPNPAENTLTVRTQLNSAAPVQVTMLDVLGKTVLAPVSVSAAQMQQSGTNLDISQLANGVYIVRVATTEGTYTTKVTVQH